MPLRQRRRRCTAQAQRSRDVSRRHWQCRQRRFFWCGSRDTHVRTSTQRQRRQRRTREKAEKGKRKKKKKRDETKKEKKASLSSSPFSSLSLSLFLSAPLCSAPCDAARRLPLPAARQRSHGARGSAAGTGKTQRGAAVVRAAPFPPSALGRRDAAAHVPAGHGVTHTRCRSAGAAAAAEGVGNGGGKMLSGPA